jgi:DNA-binding response OmpR family regulator
MSDSIQGSVMIIDDEPDNLNVLGEMLRQDGHSVMAFKSGEMALAAAREEPPDLVLLDIRMPGMDGYEVCRRFKAEDSLNRIPIIFLSAFQSPADKVRAFEAGGVDYVTKPFAEIEMLARTRTHLRLLRYQLHLEELVHQRVNELTEAHRRLRIWDDAKTQWLTTLSHEMRTPLNGLLGISDLLFMELPPDSSCHNLRSDYDLSRKRIEKLMGDAMTLTSIDVAAARFAVVPIPLAALLRGALAAVSKDAADIAVSASIDVQEGDTVLGDPDLIGRAFHDLLLTVTHCVSAGEAVALEAKVDAGQATVTIVTGGKVLPPESLETFFDVGGQRTLLKGGGDYGLGPVLASRIIRLFKGNVTVANGLDRGIVVKISLPAECAPQKTESNT